MKGSSVQKQKGSVWWSLLRGGVTNVNRKWSLPLEMVRNRDFTDAPIHPNSTFKTDVATKFRMNMFFFDYIK